jgi:predicted N-acetyltransferase YhbS
MIGPDLAITIRPETPGDANAIFALIEAAFRDTTHSDGDEPHIVNRLRANGELALSLVAEDGARIVGHIAFSPVTIKPVAITDKTSGWFGLGPVSVWPELQHRGIGSALIRRGVADLRIAGARGIVLLGNPDYYRGFGFTLCPGLTYPGAPPAYFQGLAFETPVPRGEVRYASAFATAR